MAEKSKKLRMTREAQGTSWMKMALNLTILMTIGQDGVEGDYMKMALNLVIRLGIRTNMSIMVTGTFPLLEY